MSICTRPIALEAAGRVVPSEQPQWAESLSAAERRRSPRIWQMASVAVSRALEQNSATPRSLVVATALGALDETRNFLELVFTEGHGSPRSFIASVHNSMAGKLAQDLSIAGPNLTICDGQNSFAAAIGALDLLADHDLPSLLVTVDENTTLLERLHPYLSTECRGYLHSGWPDGAVAFVCTRQRRGRVPTLRAAGPATLEDSSPEETCRALAEDAFGPDIPLIPLTTSATSYLQPALLTYELITRREQPHIVIPSYAPTAHAAAAIEICA